MFRCNKISAGILIILGLIFTLLFLSYDTQSKEPSRISKILLGRPIKVLDEFEKKEFSTEQTIQYIGPSWTDSFSKSIVNLYPEISMGVQTQLLEFGL